MSICGLVKLSCERKNDVGRLHGRQQRVQVSAFQSRDRPTVSPVTGTWCHGEAGIALTRLRAFALLGCDAARVRSRSADVEDERAGNRVRVGRDDSPGGRVRPVG